MLSFRNLIWFIPLILLFACALKDKRQASNERDPYIKKKLLIRQDFSPTSSDDWFVEAEDSNLVDVLINQKMNINVSKGIVVWHKQKLKGNIMIEFEATVVDNGGINDRVSDLNCFWMATDPRNPHDFFARSSWRSGVFWNYYSLNLYYVGLGGHDNTKTRFRKYIGSANPRPPVLQEYVDANYLIKANKKCKVKIICFNGLIQYFYNGQKLFELQEEQPYTEGYFGFRTVNNHMVIHNYQVFTLEGI